MKKIISILLVTLFITGTLAVFATQPYDLEGLENADVLDCYANLDPNTAPKEKQGKIRDAREEIIFNNSWVADGLTGSIIDEITGQEIESIPQFSDLFPGWDMPNMDIGKTEDSIMYDELYSELPSYDINPLDFALERASGVTDYRVWAVLNHYIQSASSASNAPPFTKAYVDGYNVGTALKISVRQLTSSASCNIGFSNYDTGRSLGFVEHLKINEAAQIRGLSRPQMVGCRASTYSAPGWSVLALSEGDRIMNVR